MKRQYWMPENLILCRSDAGDGGWSLHAPWATDDQIADGREPPLMSGTATQDDYGWDAPTELDRRKAFNVLSAREKCRD